MPCGHKLERDWLPQRRNSYGLVLNRHKTKHSLLSEPKAAGFEPMSSLGIVMREVETSSVPRHPPG